MLGNFYAVREQALAKEPEGSDLEALYAMELLQETLNRAKVLQCLWDATYQADLTPDRPERQRALENLAHGVEIFCRDCEEAQARAIRAGILASGSFGTLSEGVEIDNPTSIGGWLRQGPEVAAHSSLPLPPNATVKKGQPTGGDRR